MWLTPEVLRWRPAIGGSTTYRDELWRRPYRIFGHADQILQKDTTDFDRVDVITTLKRAVDNRIRLLNEIYKFKLIPIKNKPSKAIEILCYLGIIRPIMVQKLIYIRNAVEHEDAPPPDHNDCLSFLEFVWYFIRSTDHLVRESVYELILNHTEEDFHDIYYLDLIFNPENRWSPKVIGWVQPNMISANLVDKWILLNIERTETRASLLSRLGQTDDPDDIGRGKNPDDICFHGEIRGPAEHLKKIVLLYFEAI